MSKVMETFQPSAVALQCGSDSLSGDRLGCFNLTIKGKRDFLEGVGGDLFTVSPGCSAGQNQLRVL